MIPAIAGAAISGGSSLLGSAVNAVFQAQQNRKNREWSEKMYDREKADSLSFWNTQNEYNSPAQQMERLKNAGLNPHLVYGGGVNNVSAPIKTPSAPNWKGEAPQVDIGGAVSNAINTYQNVQLQKQQLDLMQEKIETEKQTRLNMQTTNFKVLSDMEKNMWSIEKEKGLYKGQLEFQRWNNELAIGRLNLVRSQNELMWNKDAREEKLTSSKIANDIQGRLVQKEAIAKSMAERDRIRAGIVLLNQQGALNAIELAFREKGIDPKGPLYERIIGTVINNVSTKGLKGAISDALKVFKP